MLRTVTEEFKERFYDSSMLIPFVREVLDECSQDNFNLVMHAYKGSDDEWYCKATVSYTK